MIAGGLELTIKAVLTATSLLAIVRRRKKKGMPARKAGPVLLALAALSLAAYYNLGIAGNELRDLGRQAFHGNGFIHYWETFHYVLGSKYFPEVGYDGLYAASVAAERESHPGNPRMRKVRDLRTNALVPYEQFGEEMQRARAQFSDARWEEFVRDNAYFIDQTNSDYMKRMRVDHGYNPSPFWTFVARIFDARGTLTPPFLVGLTCLDSLLLALMFLVIFRTYGARVGCISMILFGLGYPWRYYWIGGAFLRLDWFVATVTGVCALAKERFTLAGVLLAYAALARVFPVLFLFGIGVVALRALVRKEKRAWIYRFAAGYAGMLVLGVIAGSTVGRGFEAWPEFIDNSVKHTSGWATNNVGLENVLLYGPDTFEFAYRPPEPSVQWQEHLTSLHSQFKPLVLLAMGAMLILAAAAAWRSTPSEAAALGLVPCFTLVLLSSYYWSILVLVPLRRAGNATIGVLVVSGACILVHLFSDGLQVVYGICSWMMLVLFVAWIWPDALKTLRRVPIAEDELGPGAGPVNADMS